MALFENLAEKLQETFNKLTGKGQLKEADVNTAMREIRVALLEADVSYVVAKDFVNKIKERAVGTEVLESLTPGQQVVKIVNEELTELMGADQASLTVASKPPTIIMMVGLQGTGKTTSSGKIANILKKQGRRPLLVAADIYRPAAIKQLEVLGEQLEIPVFSMGDKVSPVDIAKASLKHGDENNNDYILIDTAGRLHIDETLMTELSDIKEAVNPDEILLVVDAMAGQDAVNVADSFNKQLEISGLVLTKMDGDTRGGAALSAKAVTGKPVKFVGVGEKLDAMEPFHPDRMASRILGMGDVLTLIEKAQDTVDEEQAKAMEEKILSAKFTFEDFLDQMDQMNKMGDIDDIIKMIPGAGKQLKNIQISEKEMGHTKAIIQSMTPEERQKPEIISGKRKQRIAKGSGMKVQNVNRLLKQFEQTRKMMKQFGGQMAGGKNKKRKKKGKKSLFNLPFFQ